MSRSEAQLHSILIARAVAAHRRAVARPGSRDALEALRRSSVSAAAEKAAPAPR